MEYLLCTTVPELDVKYIHVTSNLQVSAGLPHQESANGHAASC